MVENANLVSSTSRLNSYFAKLNVPLYPSRVIGGKLHTQKDLRIAAADLVCDELVRLGAHATTKYIAWALRVQEREVLVALRDLVAAKVVTKDVNLYKALPQ